MRNLKFTGSMIIAFLLLALPASAAGRFRGRIMVAPSARFWYWHDPFYYGPYGYYWPYWSYGGYPSFYASAGEIKLHTNVKDAEVYINGALAGKASKLKTMWLHANSYNLEVRAPGYSVFKQRIYVVPGKTVQVNAELAAAPRS